MAELAVAEFYDEVLSYRASLTAQAELHDSDFELSCKDLFS